MAMAGRATLGRRTGRYINLGIVLQTPAATID
jgi:hypothetical protein